MSLELDPYSGTIIKQPTLIVQPGEVRFEPPFNVVSSTYIKLTNPSQKNVMYKFVLPNSRQFTIEFYTGLLGPNQSKIVCISLKPYNPYPALTNDREFLLLSFTMDPDYAPHMPLDDLWMKLSTDPMFLMEVIKLKCTFALPFDDDITEESEPSACESSEETSLERTVRSMQQTAHHLLMTGRMLDRENVFLRNQIELIQEYINQIGRPEPPMPSRFAHYQEMLAQFKHDLRMSQFNTPVILGFLVIVIAVIRSLFVSTPSDA